MVESERELTYLSKPASAIVTTTGFMTMKEALVKVTASAEKESKQKPSLIGPEQGCPAPTKLVYEADQPIETICSTPQTAPAPKQVTK